MAQSITIWLGVTNGRSLPRHEYVAYVIFEVILGWKYTWSKSYEEWCSASGIKVQYGGTDAKVLNGHWIPAAGLLENDFEGELEWSDYEGQGIPGQGRLPFGVKNSDDDRVDADWWSWVFWMITRMEERDAPVNSLDQYGRFQAQHSIIDREGWLRRPEVEWRVREWAKSIQAEPTSDSYQVIPTIDVDSAFAYLHRSPWRRFGATVKDLARLDWERLNERRKVLTGQIDDPFDTYSWLENLHSSHGMRARYFFLVADRGTYDRGIDWNQPGFQNLVEQLKRTADVGVHPSFGSFQLEFDDRVSMIRTEMQRVKQLGNCEVDHARQHYLLQHYPSSWKALEQAGILHDHTMGFADNIGFRAGMSRSYRAYDLDSDTMLNLTIHPVAVMDATLKRYLNYTPEQAVHHVEQIAESVREVDGVLRLLWHNETVSDRWEWRGWRGVYEQVLQRVC